MKKKIGIELCFFELTITTDDGKRIVTQAIEREENYDGYRGLSLFFAPLCGIRCKRLDLFVYATLIGPNLKMRVSTSAYRHCDRELGESDGCGRLHLTPAQIKAITKKLNARLPAVNARWKRAGERVEADLAKAEQKTAAV